MGSPVQRAFMGDLDMSGPVKWLRVNKDLNCDRDVGDTGEASDGEAAAHSSGGGSCYWMDMGLKGGMAQDQDEPPFSFLGGNGASQMGSLDCDPMIRPGAGSTDAIVQGLRPVLRRQQVQHHPVLSRR